MKNIQTVVAHLKQTKNINTVRNIVSNFTSKCRAELNNDNAIEWIEDLARIEYNLERIGAIKDDLISAEMQFTQNQVRTVIRNW